jgi:hypothetical protein
MRYTTSWSNLYSFVKNTVGTDLADVKVGVGLNFNALDAVESQPLDAAPSTQTEAGRGSFWNLFGSQEPTAPAVKYPAIVPEIIAANVRDLLSAQLDFLGISAYFPYSSANFDLSEFEASAGQVAKDLFTLAGGVNLATLARTGKLELHYSEFGIGCGVDGKDELSPSADLCANKPWAGICGMYTARNDPWQRSDLASFRDKFYLKAVDWLGRAGSPITYNVSEVFIWSMSSWDVLGLYPDSMGYRDIAIARKVAAYNAAVQAAQVCKYKGAQECEKFAAAYSACLSDQSGAACLTRPTVNPDVVTESGSAQSGASTSTTTTPPAGSSSSTDGEQTEAGPASNSSAVTVPIHTASTQAGDKLESAAVSAPTPAAAAAYVDPNNPNLVFVGVQPAVPYVPGATTGNGAGARQITWAAPVVFPLICAAMMLL